MLNTLQHNKSTGNIVWIVILGYIQRRCDGDKQRRKTTEPKKKKKKPNEFNDYAKQNIQQGNPFEKNKK